MRGRTIVARQGTGLTSCERGPLRPVNVNFAVRTRVRTPCHRYMIENDSFGGDVLLVNTVHDCVWLDGVDSKIEQVAREAKRILESVLWSYNILHSVSFQTFYNFCI